MPVWRCGGLKLTLPELRRLDAIAALEVASRRAESDVIHALYMKAERKVDRMVHVRDQISRTLGALAWFVVHPEAKDPHGLTVADVRTCEAAVYGFSDEMMQKLRLLYPEHEIVEHGR